MTSTVGCVKKTPSRGVDEIVAQPVDCTQFFYVGNDTHNGTQNALEWCHLEGLITIEHIGEKAIFEEDQIPEACRVEGTKGFGVYYGSGYFKDVIDALEECKFKAQADSTEF